MKLLAVVIAAMLGIAVSGSALAQGMVVSIYLAGPNPNPVAPSAPINTLQELYQAIGACYSAPPLNRAVDVKFTISFKRSGELFGKPRVLNFGQPVTPEERGVFYTAVAEALDRCSNLPFTDSMGGAIAGRVLYITLFDMFHRRQA